MATSTNYGWAEPDNSSLVKNGASDIRTLGNAIDTSVWNVGYGQAGKNKIINGDFGVWQRGTTFAVGGGSYTCDRFNAYHDATGATKTISRQAFTAGTELGSNALYFFRYAVTVAGTGGSNQNNVGTSIENVQNFAGQTMTVSFYAKADATRSVTPKVTQNFGSGGSASVAQSGSAITLTTSWARYTSTFTMGSMSGKTIGTSSYVQLEFLLPGTGTFTIDLWGVQAEIGSIATPFVPAGGGSPQAELAMCQRYYYRATVSTFNQAFSMGQCYSTTQAFGVVPFPVTMRTNPSALEQSGTATDYKLTTAIFGGANCSAVPTFNAASYSNGVVVFTVAAGIVAGNAVALQSGSANGYLGWSAEL